MKWLFIISVVFLVVAPLAIQAAVAGYLLWQAGWSGWLWWTTPVCWTLAFLLLKWGWQHYGPRATITQPFHWVDRDRQAWQLVERRAAQANQIPAEQLTTAEFYLRTAQEMGLEMARSYYPNTDETLDSLTVPEILAAAELVIHDLAQTVDDYAVGSHLLSVRMWKRLAKFPGLYRAGNKAYWLIYAILAPDQTLARFAASQCGVSPFTQHVYDNILQTFYAAYVQHVGIYLIELNSGRLKVGAERWRQLMRHSSTPPAHPTETTSAPAASEKPLTLTITVVGQAKAGKSSLINALLAKQKAAVDVLPLTQGLTCYRLERLDLNCQVDLCDTPGFGVGGFDRKQRAAVLEAVCGASLVLLVMDVGNAAREPDQRLLSEMQTWFGEHPELQRTPVVGVVTHIDMLSPAREWLPPYDGWLSSDPERPKEQSIREALAYVRELFGDRLRAVVPVCTDGTRDRVYGVREWLWPALLNELPHAQMKQLLDVLVAEGDRGVFGPLWGQIWNTAQQLVKSGFSRPKLQPPVYAEPDVAKTGPSPP